MKSTSTPKTSITTSAYTLPTIVALASTFFCVACATQNANPADAATLQEIQKHQEQIQQERAKKGTPNQNPQINPQDPSKPDQKPSNPSSPSTSSLTNTRISFDLEDGIDFVVQLLLKR